jgi:carboxypeptidase family protein
VRLPRLAALLALVLLALPGALEAQVGTTTDVLTGVVKDDAGQPVADAVVEATSLETQVMRTTKTDLRGRYTLLFPDGGGSYRLIVRSIGKSPVMRTIARLADEDRLVTNITLGTVPTRLQDVVVRGNQGPRIDLGGGPPTPGSTERNFNPNQTARLPIDASDLTILATLAPGVVSISGNDSTAAGFSVAGQRPSSNSTTLDGLSFGGVTVPQDAVRNTRVITNSYDIARGQFSGGQVASTTRSGTNSIQGSGNYSLRDRDLSVSSEDSTAFAQGFTQQQLSAGFGGPLVHNKAFYFLSGQGRLRDDGLQSLLSASQASLTRLGLAPDSANHFLGFLSQHGIPLATSDSLTSRSANDFSGLARLDLNLSSNQTLTLRGDARHNRTEPTGVGTLSVPASGGITRSGGGGAMATLSSRFGPKLINELRAYYSGNWQRGESFSDLPQGRVQVVSALSGGTQSVSNLSFGGNSGLAQRRSGTALEVSEELSLLPGDAAHRLKAGLLINRASSSQVVANNLTGTFTFTSLAELENGNPSSFTRTLGPSHRASTSINSALYAGDTWRVNQALQLTYGARLEHSQFGHVPQYNPAVEQAFGFRTDRLPRETHLSPRAGFTYTIASGDEQPAPPLLTLRGGLGEFRSPIPGSLAASAQSATGLPAAEQQLFCVGPAVPTPDWEAYLLDPANIPTACLGSGGQLPTQSPQVTVFDPSFGAPRAWRGSLGAQRRLGTWMLGLDVSLARGVSQSGFTDRNLGEQRFTLAAEGARPVFVPASLIDPNSGVSPLAASRRDSRFGQVLLLDSKLGSRSASVSFSANGITRGGITLNASYTWSRSRDQSSSSEGGGQRGFAGQTAGLNPNDREWARSDFERKHSFLTVVTWPATAALELTAIGRMTSGTPYTPLVSGDINGDGSRNDRAFIFNAAAAPDTAIANGMQRLLANASDGARQCIQTQLGRIAARNSCTGPWQPSLDLQLNYRPMWLGLNRRLTISVVTQSLLAGVDQLLHGRDNLHGWGQLARPSSTLLSTRGFAAGSGRFLYTVNERFGATSAGATAIRNPFQIGLQLRYTLGSLFPGFPGLGGGGVRGAVRGAAGAAGGAGGDFSNRFASLAPNPIREMIGLRVGLRLSPEQEAKLKLISDSLTAQNAILAKALQTEIAKLGANVDGGRMMTVIRPRLEHAQKNLQAALDAAKKVLTEEQWNYLPERLKTPRGMFGPGGGDGARRRPSE